MVAARWFTFRGRRFFGVMNGGRLDMDRGGETIIRIITAIGFLAVLVAAGSAGASAPTGKVVPNMHLGNGQTVKVSGAGFSPNETIFIVECNKTVRKAGESACNLGNVGIANSNAKGRVPATKFTVQTGVIGNGKCGTSKANEKCFIAIVNASQSEIALAGILFKVK
jgi:hypothetical protein